MKDLAKYLLPSLAIIGAALIYVGYLPSAQDLEDSEKRLADQIQENKVLMERFIALYEGREGISWPH